MWVLVLISCILLFVMAIVSLAWIIGHTNKENAHHAVGLCGVLAGVVIVSVTLGLISHAYYTHKCEPAAAAEMPTEKGKVK